MARLAWCFAILIGLTATAVAQNHASVEALLDATRKDLSPYCKIVEFDDSFLIRADIDGDGHDDAVLDSAGLSCDGSSMLQCGADGCSMEIYLQDDGGGFLRVGGVFARGLEFDRPDPINPSFLAYMNGNECDRSGIEPCVRRFGIQNDELVDLGEETSAEEE